MILISQKDFETQSGQEKIVRTIHNLEHKVHELEGKLNELANKESPLAQDMDGYGSKES